MDAKSLSKLIGTQNHFSLKLINLKDPILYSSQYDDTLCKYLYTLISKEHWTSNNVEYHKFVDSVKTSNLAKESE